MTPCFAMIDDFPASPRKAAPDVEPGAGRLAPLMCLVRA
jgi:hypothetical protein